MLPTTASRSAPTRSLVPRISTEKPRLSPAPPSPAASFCSSVQAPLLRPNTYAAPWSLLAPTSSPATPTSKMPPLIATANPKLSPVRPSLASRLLARALSAGLSTLDEVPAGAGYIGLEHERRASSVRLTAGRRLWGKSLVVRGEKTSDSVWRRRKRVIYRAPAATDPEWWRRVHRAARACRETPPASAPAGRPRSRTRPSPPR